MAEAWKWLAGLSGYIRKREQSLHFAKRVRKLNTFRQNIGKTTKLKIIIENRRRQSSCSKNYKGRRSFSWRKKDNKEVHIYRKFN